MVAAAIIAILFLLPKGGAGLTATLDNEKQKVELTNVHMQGEPVVFDVTINSISAPDTGASSTTLSVTGAGGLPSFSGITIPLVDGTHDLTLPASFFTPASSFNDITVSGNEDNVKLTAVVVVGPKVIKVGYGYDFEGVADQAATTSIEITLKYPVLTHGGATTDGSYTVLLDVPPDPDGGDPSATFILSSLVDVAVYPVFSPTTASAQPITGTFGGPLVEPITVKINGTDALSIDAGAGSYAGFESQEVGVNPITVTVTDAAGNAGTTGTSIARLASDVEVVVAAELTAEELEALGGQDAVDALEDAPPDTQIALIEGASAETQEDLINGASEETLETLVNDSLPETQVALAEVASQETKGKIVEIASDKALDTLINHSEPETQVTFVEVASYPTSAKLMELPEKENRTKLGETVDKKKLVNVLPNIEKPKFEEVPLPIRLRLAYTVTAEHLDTDEELPKEADLPPPTVLNVPRLGLTSAVVQAVADWVRIFSSPAPISGMLAEFARTLTSVQVSLQDVSEKPSDVADLPQDQIVSEYFRITVENAEPEDILTVHMSFLVEKSWLEANNIHEWSILINRYDEEKGMWVSYPTKRVSEDETLVFYTVVLPGFSLLRYLGKLRATPAKDLGL